MRFRIAKIVTAFVVILNLIALYFIWKLIFMHGKKTGNKSLLINASNSNDRFIKTTSIKTLQNEVTFVFRSFESFDNDILESVKSVLNIFPNATVFIITDVPLYPPIVFNSSSIKFVNLKISLTNSFKDRNPALKFCTKYVFFIPDSTRFISRKLLDKLIDISNNHVGKLIAIPFKGAKVLKCLSINLDVREWQIRFYEYRHLKECDLVNGKHALFIERELLLNVSDPFMLPFPESLYIQSSYKQNKVILAEEISLNNGRELFKNNHLQWKAQQAYTDRQKAMYQNLELKKVIRENGVVEWFGCRRDTPRCFGSIIDETPQYLWEGKWTPPCCLVGLRRTARHVFEQLEEVGVRYWLEGGSLLGAMRNNDILPWDYDVDIGIYREDISRCTWLMRAGIKPITDPLGFVWEKAVEGDFYRVQFSQVNRLHVDIFPFYSKNGTMTKDTWFKSHRQDREFPEHYLKPLSTIEFVGRMVSAPNNIHDFLEFKFGVGVIENPEYPNPHKMASLGHPLGPPGR